LKFSLVRPALLLGVAALLSACGGGKATYPIQVTVYNVQYDGLILSTNGQDVAVPKSGAGSAYTFSFPNQIEYGVVYDVVPKGQNLATGVLGAQPAHQTCSPSSTPPKTPSTATAGQFASIDITYTCVLNSFQIGGTIKGLKTTGLVLINGSTASSYVATPTLDTSSVPTGADIAFAMPTTVPWGTPYGVTILTQPTGQTCTIANGVGTIDQAVETAGLVKNIVVTCQ
jgi:hypothetical protein